MIWSPYSDEAGRRGEEIAAAFERARGASVTDVSRGGHPLLASTFERLGIERPPRASADFVTVLDDETRVIEVKTSARAGGEVVPRERQVETWRRLGSAAWLYVVRWVMDDATPTELWLVQDPARALPWEPAERRFPEENRGRATEHFLRCTFSDVRASGTQADIEAAIVTT